MLYGTFKELRWLLSSYSKHDIIETFTKKPTRMYPKDMYRFIKDYLLGLTNVHLNEEDYVTSISGSLRPRQAVFRKLAEFSDRFTLARGTAIMLQIGHRESYDFDCFTPNQGDISPNLFRKTKRVFGINTRKILENSDMLFVHTPENIELNFVCYPYKALQKTVSTSSLPIFHLDDLAASKTNTIGRRPQ